MIRRGLGRHFWVAIWDAKGYRGTWNREAHLSCRLGPWRLSFAVHLSRTREKAGAPDWPQSDTPVRCFPGCPHTADEPNCSRHA